MSKQNIILSDLTRVELIKLIAVADGKVLNLTGVNFNYVDLRCLDLSGANLSNANLSNAILDNANLSGANLSNANLSNAKLDRANFSSANLTKAIFEYISNSDTDFTNADLTKVTFPPSTAFYSAKFFRANLSETRFEWSMRKHLFGNSTIYRSKFCYCDFTEANLTGAGIAADIAGSDFTNANLTGANLKYAENINEAKFIGAKLTGIQGYH